MSYQPPDARPPYQQPPVVAGWQPAPMPPAVTPEPKSRAIPVLLGALAVAIIGVAVLIAIAVKGGIGLPTPTASKAPGLTQAGAERACRTAFGKEWKSRAAGVTDKDVITSVQNIEMLDATKTAGGYTVNGTVHFTLTTGVLDPIADTLDLTCTASGSDASPVTTVDNRN